MIQGLQTKAQTLSQQGYLPNTLFATNNRCRVELQTNQETNARLRAELKRRYDYYDTHRDEIEHRLQELDNEWDVERAIFLMAGFLIFMISLIGLRLLHYFLAFGLTLHSCSGWTPLLPLLRNMGFRTLPEINDERYALMAMRGDFGGKPKSSDQVFDKTMMAAKPIPQT